MLFIQQSALCHIPTHCTERAIGYWLLISVGLEARQTWVSIPSLWDLGPILVWVAGCKLGTVTHLPQRLSCQGLARTRCQITVAPVGITMTSGARLCKERTGPRITLLNAGLSPWGIVALN